MTGAHPAYEQLRPVSEYASVILADNPGAMTLDGTNTWLLRDPRSAEVVVVDPGPDDDRHLEAVAGVADVAVVLLTHWHSDHSAGAARLHERTGAPVRAVDPQFRTDAAGLADGEVIAAAGVRVRVWATPGHTSDSVCFVLESSDDRGAPSGVLTGDTVLGRGTTVVTPPDGRLADYLQSLRRLRELGDVPLWPGHGPELPSAGEAAERYLAHREQRLDEVRAALAALGPDATPQQIVERVYADVDPAVRFAAEMSVQAQLDYLRN